MTTTPASEFVVDLERARRMAALRDCLCDPEHTFHWPLVEFADMLLDLDDAHVPDEQPSRPVGDDGGNTIQPDLPPSTPIERTGR